MFAKPLELHKVCLVSNLIVAFMDKEPQLRKEIDRLVEEMKQAAANVNTNRDAWWIAKQSELYGNISALSDIVSKRAEKITQRLVWLTWCLLILTAALLLITLHLP